METLSIAVLLALGLTVLLRVLLPTRQPPPQIIYVQALPETQPSGSGCLPLLIAGIIIIMLVVLGT